MYACREGYTDLVQMLIDSDVSVNSVSNVGWSALHYSCLRGHFRLVKLLLANNINVNIENNMSNTAAYFAFKSGNVEIVKILLEHGLQVSAKDIADILWLVKFWTAFVPGTNFIKYEQFLTCLFEMFKYKTLVDQNEELTLCLIETVYRTYMRQKFDVARDKNVQNIIKYLLKLSVYIGHIKQIKLLTSPWFSSYFNLTKPNLNCHEIDLKFVCLYETFEINHSQNNENILCVYKDFRDLLLRLTREPMSLMALCRQTIRNNMTVYNRKSINQLHLPAKLYKYLSFDCL
jgi:hypothetical protein